MDSTCWDAVAPRSPLLVSADAWIARHHCWSAIHHLCDTLQGTGRAAANCYLQYLAICINLRQVANSWFIDFDVSLLPSYYGFLVFFEDGKLGNAAVARPLCWSPMPSWQLHCWQATCAAPRWSAVRGPWLWIKITSSEPKLIRSFWVCLTSKRGTQWPETCEIWPNFTDIF